MRVLSRSLLLAPLLFAPVLLSGCDEAGGSGTFPVTISDVLFTFQFDGSAVIGAEPQLSAEEVRSVLDELPIGFSAADVVSVRLADGSAQVRILLAPAGTEIDFLNEATLSLASGSTSTVVASQDDFGSMTGSMAGEAALDVNGADVGAIVADGDFGALLDVDAVEGEVEAGASYALEVQFDLELELEG